ncbi:MAG: flotillin-like FloA family protein, partial [Pirellula sp.]
MNSPLVAISIFVAVAGAILALIVIAVFTRYFWLWIQAVMTGAKVGVFDLIGMLFRRVDARTIVRSKIMAVQAGINDPDLTTKALEAHYLARGNVPQVIRALIAARKSRQITLSFREAAAIDLAGRNVLDAVQTSVYPKVID